MTGLYGEAAAPGQNVRLIFSDAPSHSSAQVVIMRPGVAQQMQMRPTSLVAL